MSDELTTKPHEWERQIDETDAQWQAFQCYLQLGIGRTLDAAWEAYREARGLKTKVRGPHFTQWSRDNSWFDRATAFDATLMETGMVDRADAQRRVHQKFWSHAPDIIDETIKVALGLEGREQCTVTLRMLADRLLPAKATAHGGTVINAQNVQINKNDVRQLSNEEIIAALRQSE